MSQNEVDPQEEKRDESSTSHIRGNTQSDEDVDLGVLNDDDPSAQCIRNIRYHGQAINWIISHYDPNIWGQHWRYVEYKLRVNLHVHIYELICFAIFKKSSRELNRYLDDDDEASDN